MKDIKTNKDYQDYTKLKTPNSPLLKNCLNAFIVGRINLRNWSIYIFDL